MNMAAYQWQGLGLRVAEIASRIHQTLCKPDPHEPGFIGLSGLDEMQSACDGKEELPNRATEKMHGRTHEAQKHMPGFMEEQVHTVDEMVVVVEGEPAHVDEKDGQEESFGDHIPSSAKRLWNFSCRARQANAQLSAQTAAWIHLLIRRAAIC